MAGVKLLVGPHDCHQIFRFTQIDNIVGIARQHMNSLDPVAADLEFDLFIRNSIEITVDLWSE